MTKSPEISLEDWHEISQDWNSSPNHNSSVWVFIPDLGNDDEGYGMVVVGRCDLDWPKARWFNIYGNEIYPVRWAFMNYPEIPEDWISWENTE